MPLTENSFEELSIEPELPNTVPDETITVKINGPEVQSDALNKAEIHQKQFDCKENQTEQSNNNLSLTEESESTDYE